MTGDYADYYDRLCFNGSVNFNSSSDLFNFLTPKFKPVLFPIYLILVTVTGTRSIRKIQVQFPINVG